MFLHYAYSVATEDSSEGYKVLWAKSKPWHPLWKHLIDVAAVSVTLPNPLRRWNFSADQVALIAGLHDIGKSDAAFQYQAPEFGDRLCKQGFLPTEDARCRHERLSAQFIRSKLKEANTTDRGADTIGRAVLAHHGYWNEGSRPVGEAYRRAQESLCELLLDVLGRPDLHLPEVAEQSALGMRLAGHIVLCDWIASNEEFFTDERLRAMQDPAAYFGKAKEVASIWVEKLNLVPDSSEGQPQAIVANPRPLQAAILENDIPPALVIIEAPMGEGKTETAWILAEKWRSHGYHGMYMALPTMATSDSLHSRYRDDYLRKLGRGEAAHLVHGMSWLRDELEPIKSPNVGEPGDDRSTVAAWFRPTRRAMLAAHGVGTVDQPMLAGMHVKFGFLRLFGLADRVLVIDEVHAYDAYMTAIICRLLQWCACLKIPVILLSATLSAKQRSAMIEAYGSTGDLGANAPYPLISIADTEKHVWSIPTVDPSSAIQPRIGSSSRTLKIEICPGLLGNPTKTAEKAKELIVGGGCCCVILNTVKQAQAVYKALGKEVPKLLFHARFTAKDRERIASEVIGQFGKGKTRPPKFVLVATQVVEQSLDVDFDHMISEIAPTDLLLQRSGRLHRHRPRSADPVLHVLTPGGTKDRKAKSGAKVNGPVFGACELIYQRHPLLTTLDLIGNELDAKLPGDFRMLIEKTYADDLPEGASSDLTESKTEWNDLQEDLAAQAGEFLLCEPMADEFDPVGYDEVGDDSDDGNGWRARTRLGLEDVLVIPLEQEEINKWKGGDLPTSLVKSLYQRSVKIPPHYWPPKAADGYGQPILGEKKLKGVWLLPVHKKDDEWEWQGQKEGGKPYTINYNADSGLTHGGDK